MSQRTIIAVSADAHSGSTVGLMPVGQWQTEDGYHNPGATQRRIWEQWRHCWTKVGLARKKSRLISVHAGDASDGNHHGTSQIWTSKPEEQERAHISCMETAHNLAGFNKRKGDLQYYVAGTEAHSGNGFQSEERIARDLEAEPFIKDTARDKKDGQYLWHYLKLELESGSVRFDISHHGPGPGTRVWTKGNVIRSMLKSIYLESLEMGSRIPKKWVYVWAHNHRYAHEVIETNAGELHGFLLPAFQAATHYVNRVQHGIKVSNIGMMYFVIDGDEFSYHKDIINLFDERSAIKL